MKKSIVSILVAIIIVMMAYIIFGKYQSSKSAVQNNNQGTIQIVPDTEKQLGDLFTRKKECASYKDKIMEDILTPNLVYKDGDPELAEIFYSPKRNSCLYVFEYYTFPDCLRMDANTYGKICLRESLIVDFLTKEIIYDSSLYNNCVRFSKNCKTVSERAEELKN